jgi:WD40 repeat protein
MRIEPMGNHHLLLGLGRTWAASCLGLALVVVLCQPAAAEPLPPHGIFDTGDPSEVYFNAVALSPDGYTVAFGTRGKTPLTLFDTSNGKKLPGPNPGDGGVSCLAFAPDGSSLAVGSVKGPTRLFKAGTWQLVHKLQHSYGTWHLAYAPGGKLLATVEYNENVCLWDVDSGKEVATLPFQQGNWLCRVAFSSDGKTLAAANSHGVIELHDLSGPAPLKDFTKKPRVLKCGAEMLSFVGFTPDSRTLVTVCDLHLVQVWDVATGMLRDEPLRPLKLFPVKKFADWLPALSPDGKTLALPGKDCAVELVDLATGKTWAKLGHNCAGRQIAFSKDGTALTCAGTKGMGYLFKIPKKS